MKTIFKLFLLVMLCIPASVSAQRIQNSNYGTAGYINSDGRVQDSNYRTIGYAKDVPVSGAALFFFFMK